MRVCLVAFAVLCVAVTATATATATEPLQAGWTSLYGVSPTLQLEAISPQTGHPIQVSNPIPGVGQGQGLSTMDAANGVFYLVTTNITSGAVGLTGLSAATGTIESETPLPLQSSPLIGVGQFIAWDASRDVALVAGQNFAKDEYILLRVDPETGGTTRLAKFPDVHLLDVLGGACVYDGSADTFWITLALNVTNTVTVKLYGFSAADGQLVNIIDNPDYMTSMVYDHVTTRVIGLGARVNATGSLERTVVAFTSATTSFEVLGVVPGYELIMSDVLAINTANQVIYFLGHNGPMDNAQPYTSLDEFILARKAGTDVFANPPSMDLVTASIKGLKVLYHPQACAEFPDCPWSLQYANPVAV